METHIYTCSGEESIVSYRQKLSMNLSKAGKVVANGSYFDKN